MKSLAAIILAFIACGAGAQSQAPSPALTPAKIYSTSVSAPAIAARCAEVFSEFKNDFEPKFADWKNRNSTAIEAGREARKATLKPGKTIEEDEKSMAFFIRVGIDSFQGEHLKNRCEYLLEQVATAEGSGT